MIIRSNNQGITLIEAIVYIALVAVVLTGVISLALNIIDLKARHLAMRDVLAGSGWANTVISQKIRAGESVSSPDPGQASSTLELAFYTGDTARIFLSVDRLWLSENGGPNIPLTPEYLKLSNLEFERSLSGSRVDNINYEFDLGTDKIGAYDFSVSLNSSASTR